MKLSLKNYQKIFSAATQKAAEKYSVRECDETEKGVFVAYIDKGNETFDVSLSFNATSVVTAAGCDCSDSDDFCLHRLALLLHLAKQKTVTSPKLKGAVKKKNEAEQLLEEVSLEDIKAWLTNILAKNADIKFSFVNYFKSTHQKYSPEECVTLTQDVWKAAVKSKKTIDQTQLKKAIELWGEAHQNIIKQYLQDVGDFNAFLCIHHIIKTCEQYYYSAQINSVRIPRYIEQLLHQTRQTIVELHTEDAWNKAIGYIVTHVADGHKPIRIYYLNHLIAMCDVISNDRRNKLLHQLMLQYKEVYHDGLFEGKSYTMLMFDTINKYDLFAGYRNYFKPLYFENDFNYKLINALIDQGDYSVAEAYCIEQINGNYKDEYSIPYWRILKEIYKGINEEAKLAGVLSVLLPFTFELEDYIYVRDRISNEEEKKKWRTKILSRAKNAYQNREHSGRFYIEVLYNEGKVKKMIEEVTESLFSYRQIAEYFDIMAAANKNSLLAALISRRADHGSFYNTKKNDESEASISLIAEKLLRHFDKDYLKLAITKNDGNRWYQPNRLVLFMKQLLQ